MCHAIIPKRTAHDAQLQVCHLRHTTAGFKHTPASGLFFLVCQLAYITQFSNTQVVWQEYWDSWGTISRIRGLF